MTSPPRSRILPYILLALLLATAFPSCKTRQQYIPAENVRIEYRDRHTTDSITTVDTVRIAERGDTVYVDRIRYRDRVRFERDTLLRVDTVTRIQIVEVEVQPSFFQQAERLLNTVGLILLLAAVAYLAGRYLLPWILKKSRK